jgi:Protein of unknown function (DUF3160).
MTNQAWIDKSLTTASGSWAELRHATVLYAKQSYTGVGIPCPNSMCFPQGYVEPNPDVFGRLAAMVSFMKSGFDSVGISQMLPISKLTDLSSLCVELRDIAIQELQEGGVTNKQYRDIAGSYKVLTNIEDFSKFQVPPSTTYNPQSGDSSTACIIDVHTDPNSKQVLEVGEGNPMCLYVTVPVEGKLQICRGAMFSYYEFLHPMSDRMTDAEWKVMLMNSKPAMPAWTGGFSSGTDQSMYRSYGEDLTDLVSTNDIVPESFSTEDSVVAVLQSDLMPFITVESKGTSTAFYGLLINTGSYRVVVPSGALGDTNILTINSQVKGATTMYCFPPSEVPVSYRKVLVKDYHVAIAAARQPSLAAAHPRFQNNRLLLPPGTAWRVIDTRGRQVAFIKPETRLWVPSSRFAHMQLFLVPVTGQSQPPMRFVIGD